MQLPCIHTNGTRKEDLLRALCDAANVLEAARIALDRTAPNGRDYYPFGPEAIREWL